MVERLAANGWPGLRRWAARKAADRALHWAALARGADDAYVLARLGLYPLALDRPCRDARAAFGVLLARAALGRIDRAELADADRLSRRDRRLLAGAVAPLSREHAEAAARLLPPEERSAVLACRLAAGEEGLALPEAGGAAAREIRALRAMIAARAGDHRSARAEIGAMFAADGLAPPLAAADIPAALEDFETPEPAAEHGPKVSLIVPVHDGEATIATAIRSLQRQSWRNLEILVVDDRSRDGGPAAARGLAQADERIRVIANSRAPGVYGARNTGTKAATGEYLGFLDADDWSPAERIARQVAGLGDAPFALANHIRLAADGGPFAPRVFPIVRQVPITLLARRETLIAAGPFEEVATGADSEMLGRLEKRYGKRAAHRDPAVLLVARWREGSLSEAREGGMLGAERLAYRADWMFRHAGLAPPCLPAAPAAA